jgi:hypothetical protein
MDGQADLFEIIGALHPVCGFTNLLDCRKEQSDQNRNDGDYDQKLNQGKRASFAGIQHGKTPNRKISGANASGW